MFFSEFHTFPKQAIVVNHCKRSRRELVVNDSLHKRCPGHQTCISQSLWNCLLETSTFETSRATSLQLWSVDRILRAVVCVQTVLSYASTVVSVTLLWTLYCVAQYLPGSKFSLGSFPYWVQIVPEFISFLDPKPPFDWDTSTTVSSAIRHRD